MKNRYVTFMIQKSGRPNLGTAVHKFLDCPCLLKTSSRIIDIQDCDELVQALPKCSFCFDRKDNK